MAEDGLFPLVICAGFYLSFVSYLPKLCCMNRTDRVIMDGLLAKHDVLMSNDLSSSSKPYPIKLLCAECSFSQPRTQKIVLEGFSSQMWI